MTLREALARHNPDALIRMDGLDTSEGSIKALTPFLNGLGKEYGLDFTEIANPVTMANKIVKAIEAKNGI